MIRITKLEEDILNMLWKLEKAFPKVLIEHLKKPVPPYNTVLSSIRKLERLGYIDYRKYGKSHEYFPLLQKEEYGHSIFRKLFDDLLGGSNEAMLSYFIKSEKIDIEELEKLVKKMKDNRDDC